MPRSALPLLRLTECHGSRTIDFTCAITEEADEIETMWIAKTIARIIERTSNSLVGSITAPTATADYSWKPSGILYWSRFYVIVKAIGRISNSRCFDKLKRSAWK
jgi:hypothetical protein